MIGRLQVGCTPLDVVVVYGLSGGIFGDHASPLSDTTIISSMSAASAA